MFFVTAIRRAFTSNPRAVPVSDRENATLKARGIQQPAMQSYFAWRRGVLVFVVLSAILSAGLATFREYTETGERIDVQETIAKHFRLDEHGAIRAALGAQSMGDEDEEEESMATADQAPKTALQQFSDFLDDTGLYLLALAALAASVLWTRFQFTFQIMVGTFVLTFLVPLLLGFCPWSWWEKGYADIAYNPQTQTWQYFERIWEGLKDGALYLVPLLPAVLSLVPGVQRACIRVKMLLPQSILPGSLLVIISPFYAMFLLVIFVSINQLRLDSLFSVGMLLFIAAPLTYAVQASLFTKPLTSESDYRRIRVVKGIAGAITALAGALLVAYLAKGEIWGVRLLGTDPKSALMVPLDLVEFFLEFVTRAMFITVLGADLFMRMNLTAWKHTRDFTGSPEAADYDRVMGEFERVV